MRYMALYNWDCTVYCADVFGKVQYSCTVQHYTGVYCAVQRASSCIPNRGLHAAFDSPDIRLVMRGGLTKRHELSCAKLGPGLVLGYQARGSQ